MIRNKTLGVILIFGPLVLLPLTMGSYIIESFALVNGSNAFVTGFGWLTTLITVCLNLAAIVVGLSLGIYFLNKKESNIITSLRKNPAYKNLSDEQINYIASWSWAAFINPFVWALGNKMWYAAIGCLIPIYNIFVWLRLAMEGRQLAWEKVGWSGFESFKKHQKTMFWIALVVLVLILGSYVLAVKYKIDLFGPPATEEVSERDRVEQSFLDYIEEQKEN